MHSYSGIIDQSEHCQYSRSENFLKKSFSFFFSKGIIYDNQFGFRKNHSTSHAVHFSVDKILDGISRNKYMLGIFIDLSKAFDSYQIMGSEELAGVYFEVISRTGPSTQIFLMKHQT